MWIIAVRPTVSDQFYERPFVALNEHHISDRVWGPLMQIPQILFQREHEIGSLPSEY